MSPGQCKVERFSSTHIHKTHKIHRDSSSNKHLVIIMFTRFGCKVKVLLIQSGFTVHTHTHNPVFILPKSQLFIVTIIMFYVLLVYSHVFTCIKCFPAVVSLHVFVLQEMKSFGKISWWSLTTLPKSWSLSFVLWYQVQLISELKPASAQVTRTTIKTEIW